MNRGVKGNTNKKDPSKVDALFFGAHPDDIELGCGATVAKLSRLGYAVGLVDLTRGEMGTRGDAATRARESAAASRALGARWRHHLDLGDGGLRGGREAEIEIMELVCAHQPQIVFVSYPEDRHPDHARAGRLVTEATFYAGLRQLMGQRAHRPQQVIYYFTHATRDPSFIVDVSKTFAVKMRAVACYKSQFHVVGASKARRQPATIISSPKFLAAIEGRARFYGAQVGAEFGEAFLTAAPVRIDDPISVFRGYEP